MNTDEAEIRALIDTWLAATKAGDTASVLSLMTEDAVFLVPGRPPMSKAEFARVSSGAVRPLIDGASEIQEVVVAGDWAFCRTQLRVAVTLPGASAPIIRSGPTLTVFQKREGRWLLARDANLLTVEPPPAR